MEVIEQEGHQTAGQSGGKYAEILEDRTPDHRDRHVENGDRKGYRGGQTVHTVGDIDGIDAAYDNEGGEDHEQGPGQRERDMQEGEIQVRGEISSGAQQNDEKNRPENVRRSGYGAHQ